MFFEKYVLVRNQIAFGAGRLYVCDTNRTASQVPPFLIEFNASIKI